jgi:hypothetical protein
MRRREGRRAFLGKVAALGAVPLAGPVAGDQTGASAAPRLAVDDLGLPPEVRADLASFAEPVLREAAWLEELPLDGALPAFVFVPRG